MRAKAAARGALTLTPRAVTTALANTFGTAFRVTTFGESHGGGVGCVVDGVPPRLQLSNAELQARPARGGPAAHAGRRCTHAPLAASR